MLLSAPVRRHEKRDRDGDATDEHQECLLMAFPVWHEYHQHPAGHPKTVRAAKALGVPVAHLVGHLVCLWHWALDYAEDGDLTGYSDAELADAAQWEGDPAEFVKALIECGDRQEGALDIGTKPGFIDDERSLHNWKRYTAKVIRDRYQRAGKPLPGKGEVAPSDEARELCNYFVIEHCRKNGHPVPEKGSRTSETWLREMDLLLRRGPSGVEKPYAVLPDEVRTVIDYVAQDEGDGRFPGWSVVCRTVPSLRQKYDRILPQAKRPRRSGRLPDEQLVPGDDDRPTTVSGSRF